MSLFPKPGDESVGEWVNKPRPVVDLPEDYPTIDNLVRAYMNDLKASPSVIAMIPVGNRVDLAERCIKQYLEVSKGSIDVHVYQDGWAGGHELMQKLPVRYSSLERAGIHQQRRQHFEDFITCPERGGDYLYLYLYLTDADAIHDPDWLGVALGYHEAYDGAYPVSLYNSRFHERETLEEHEHHFIRRNFPGISVLLSRAQVEKIVKHIDEIGEAWDYEVPRILGNRCVVSKTSYVEHLGAGGMHTPPGDWERDRAINPTAYLVAERQRILKEMGVLNA